MGLQAFVYKYYGQRNARQFAPHTLREAVPGERAGPVSGGFLQLEGLGKIAYSNVRRPKPLMDVSAEAAEVRCKCSGTLARSGYTCCRHVMHLQSVMHAGRPVVGLSGLPS